MQYLTIPLPFLKLHFFTNLFSTLHHQRTEPGVAVEVDICRGWTAGDLHLRSARRLHIVVLVSEAVADADGGLERTRTLSQHHNKMIIIADLVYLRTKYTRIARCSERKNSTQLSILAFLIHDRKDGYCFLLHLLVKIKNYSTPALLTLSFSTK